MDLAGFLEAVAAPQLRKTMPRSTTGTTLPAFPRHRLSDLEGWSDIRGDIRRLLDPLMGCKGGVFRSFADIFPRNAQRWAACGDEAGVVRLGTHVYEQPVVQILAALFSINGDFGDHRNTLNIGDPDRVFYTYAPAPHERSVTKFLIE
ncbi:hypothetical protein TWF481_006201 [Arthrobotrys musiformis]|uniref:Uncharacterized protein n=1 Tax=Arthrobotrys musiformis TaxID=47236 RepID=A0AAV9WLQ4_9PEZI